MKRKTVVPLGAIAMAAMSSPARSESPVSPWEMAVATEQWLVEGAGARFPDTGCYEFADPDGTVFWTVVPVAPLTWNWISPFRSPLRPDARDLYSPFRIAREWLLLSPAEFDSRAESAENAEPLVTRHSSLGEGGEAEVRRGAGGPASDDISTKNSSSTARLDITSQYKEP